ncbi:MAG: hypothetical protein M0Z69_15110 [Actinomycetota bacterium]|nr:hypothetical protein [Actinomycetota bacterium]
MTTFLTGSRRLPAKGRIEVVRYVRSDQVLDLFGKKIKLDDDQAHQYVTALIRAKAGEVTVVNMDGEVVHEGDYRISRTLR